MKIGILLIISMLISCAEAPEQNATEQWPKPRPGLTPQPNVSTAKKPSSNHVLKGYQDNIQRAKDMEQEVLKAAQRQRKAIDG